jgi:hypothetical protein
MQISPRLQAWPQAPQWRWSVRTSTQLRVSPVPASVAPHPV